MQGSGVLLAEATALVASAAREALVLRLLGGIAVEATCPASSEPPFARERGDVDFVAAGKVARVEEIFARSLWTADAEFNLYNGETRLCFHKDGNKADVFMNGFSMCHTIPLDGRLGLDPLSIPLAELLLTKLQVVEANRKDLTDAACILVDHEVAESDGPAINAGAIARAVAADWGLWKTVVINFAKLRVWLEACGHRAAPTALERLGRLESAIAAVPKSLSWKLRAKIGERLRWYDLPEEAER